MTWGRQMLSLPQSISRNAWGDDRFSLTPAEFSSIHRRIFTGVIRHAGEFREYDITKREKVLRGDTVDYAPASDLPEALIMICGGRGSSAMKGSHLTRL